MLSATVSFMMNRDWLATTPESALEPELEIVDPHHHLWDYESLYGRYEIDDLAADTAAGHNVTETVFIDCGANYFSDGPRHLRPVGETVYVTKRASLSITTPGARIAAIVGHADLTLGDGVREVLDAHREAATVARFSGIRHSGARADDPTVPVSRTEPPADLYQRADFQAGARVLADMGLSFEAWQYHHQLPEVVALARAVPELTIVVNHLGGPLGVGRWAGQWAEVEGAVRTGLSALSELPNVVLKVGGIGMTRTGTGWEQRPNPPTSDEVVAYWGDLLRFAIDTFGPERCMFESNFPVDGATVSYVVLWNAFKKVSRPYSPAERAALFSATARRVYGI